MTMQEDTHGSARSGVARAEPRVSTPEAAVIIPHYNDSVRLERCLTALMANPYVDEAEVVVVDNGSSEDLSFLAEAFPNVTLVVEPMRGAAAARNRGVAVTTAPRLLFLDADCVPSRAWYEAAVDGLAGRDLVGGDIHVFHESGSPLTGAQAFEAVFAFDQEAYVTKKGFSVTANLLTWRTIFERVGPFRPHVPEDLDWCQRACAKGYALVFDPNVTVAHPSRGDWQALEKKWKRLTREAASLALAGRQSRLKWAMRSFGVLGSVARDLPKALTSARLEGPGDRVRASATLVRLRVARALWMVAALYSPSQNASAEERGDDWSPALRTDPDSVQS